MAQFTGSYYLEYENRSSYYTFTPRTLSDLRIDDSDDETNSLLTAAHRQLGILEGIIRTSTSIERFSSLLYRYEAVLSCQLANINISMFDLWDTYSKNEPGISAVKSYQDAMQYGFAHIHKTQTPLKRFCQIYRNLTGLGIIEQIGGQNRYRRFIYKKMLDVLVDK